MKFWKKPQEAWKKLENILKKFTRIDFQSRKHPAAVPQIKTSGSNADCPVCDGAFFSSLANDTSVAVSYFNNRAKKLLKLHLQAAGFRLYFISFKEKLRRTHFSMTEEVHDLVFYALTAASQINQLLKNFDENCCNQGPAFRSQAQSLQNEILRSPWLRELVAMRINLGETNGNSGIAGLTPSTKGYNLKFNDGRPSLSCELFDSIKLDVDLTCPICLETVFDPVSLKCGHILCKMCACSAASVSIVDGLKSAEPQEKCPLCRQAGVYEGAVHMPELSMLLSQSCSDYWEKRLRMERVERVKQAKEYWKSQRRAFAGI